MGTRDADTTTKKLPKCKYCDAGEQPNESGEHWIVKSIIPARISIQKCKRVTVAP